VRVIVYGTGGRGFESLPVAQFAQIRLIPVKKGETAKYAAGSSVGRAMKNILIHNLSVRIEELGLSLITHVSGVRVPLRRHN